MLKASKVLVGMQAGEFQRISPDKYPEALGACDYAIATAIEILQDGLNKAKSDEAIKYAIDFLKRSQNNLKTKYGI